MTHRNGLDGMELRLPCRLYLREQTRILSEEEFCRPGHKKRIFHQDIFFLVSVIPSPILWYYCYSLLLPFPLYLLQCSCKLGLEVWMAGV